MPLVTCPDCERRISDAAPVCVNCGRPMLAQHAVATAVRTPPAATAPRARGVGSQLACPRCGSEDTRKVSLVHAEGTSTLAGSVRGSAVGFTGGSVGIAAGSASIDGAQQTVLSQRLAPPTARTYNGATAAMVVVWFVAFFISVGMGAGVGLAWLVSSGVAIAAFYAASREDREWNAHELPKRRAEWERKFLCRRCGEVFVTGH